MAMPLAEENPKNDIYGLPPRGAIFNWPYHAPELEPNARIVCLVLYRKARRPKKISYEELLLQTQVGKEQLEPILDQLIERGFVERSNNSLVFVPEGSH
jgi:hypothetical protein